MVLESLINPLRAEQRPFSLLLLGFAHCTVGLFLALWIFEEQASLIMIFLTAMAAIPLVYNTIKMEEEKDDTIASEKTLLKEHSKALLFFLFLFFGALIAFTLWYLVLPASITTLAFSTQTTTITNLNQQITGNVISSTLFAKIFLNNLKVLIFCILFSFIYGFGAVFILTWNASVIGVALGNFIKSHLSTFASEVGFPQVSSYFYGVSLSLARYMVHGIPEIIAYIIGGFAGGIISVAVIRHQAGTKKFFHIFADAADLIFISIGFLLLAAVIEVWLTPMFFS